MKRFTDTAKWDDPWFRGLSGVQKLIFLYVIDRCNNAGFWERDDDAMCFHTKLKSELIEGAWKGLSRGLIGASGWVWVRRFLRHQKNENLTIENPAHKQIINLISDQLDRFKTCPEFQEFLAPVQGLLSPIGTGEGKGTRKKGAGEKPSREEAHTYGKELGMSGEDVDGWYDHFESNGWRVSGRTPMKDWKAGLRNGKRNAPTIRPGALNGLRSPDNHIPSIEEHDAAQR